MAIGNTRNLIAPLSEEVVEKLKSDPTNAIPQLYEEGVFDEFAHQFRAATTENDKILLERLLREEFSKIGAIGTERTLATLVQQEIMKSDSETIRIGVLGSQGSGKTCAILRVCDNTFTDSFIGTMGVDFKYVDHMNNYEKFKLQMWDQNKEKERFRNITAQVDLSMHVYLITVKNDDKSFEEAEQLIGALRKRNPERPILIVGTMSADEDPDFHKKLQTLSENHGNVPFTRINSKTKFGINELKDHIGNIYRQSKPKKIQAYRQSEPKETQAAEASPIVESRPSFLTQFFNWFSGSTSSNSAQQSSDNDNKPKLSNPEMIRIQVRGSEQSGKSSTILKVCDDIFTDSHIATLRADFKYADHQMNNDTFKLQMWDQTNERFRDPKARHYPRDIILITVKNDEKSFEEAERIIEEVRKYKPEKPLLIVGTMSADEDPDFHKKLQTLSERHGNVPFTRINCKTNFGIKDLKDHIGNIYRQLKPKETEAIKPR